ncbi:hypothetical protein GCM10027596_27630 [Nocardioides korecus]
MRGDPSWGGHGRGGEGDCCVVVVGAGAGGALTACHLLTGLSPRYRVALVDPSPTTGRGPAYATTDDRHLLNVPVSGMSAFPRDAEHFHRWVRRHHDAATQPQDFVPRRVYGDYVEDLLTQAADFPGNARLERRHDTVVGIDRRGDRFVVRLNSGPAIVARAVVLATGARPGTAWAPAELRASARLVDDPWTQELPDGDLLLVGTGLTMVDVALSAAREGRTLHTVSRHDELPRAHRVPTTPAVPPPPGITRVTDLAGLRRTVTAHVERTRAATGDWRPAVDGLRPVTAQLWQGLDEADRRTFVEQDARDWDVHRHRMPPARPGGWTTCSRPAASCATAAPSRPCAAAPRAWRSACPTAPPCGSPGSSAARARSARSRPTRCCTPSPGRAWCARDRPGWASTPATTAGSPGCCPRGCRSTRSGRCGAATCGRPRRCRRSASRPTTWPGRSCADCTGSRDAVRATCSASP